MPSFVPLIVPGSPTDHRKGVPSQVASCSPHHCTKKQANTLMFSQLDTFKSKFSLLT